MKRSEIYYEAALAVIDDDTLRPDQKFDIVAQLIRDMDLSKVMEERAEKIG